MAQFSTMFKDADREYALELDKEGYAYQYVKGAKHEVATLSFNKNYGKGNMLIHNHPSGGAFSDLDLINTALTTRAGIVAVGTKYTYTFRKNGNHFKADAFAKAVKNARPKGKDYSDAVDKWLTENQTKYGYTYSRTKTNTNTRSTTKAINTSSKSAMNKNIAYSKKRTTKKNK